MRGVELPGDGRRRTCGVGSAVGPPGHGSHRGQRLRMREPSIDLESLAALAVAGVERADHSHLVAGLAACWTIRTTHDADRPRLALRDALDPQARRRQRGRPRLPAAARPGEVAGLDHAVAGMAGVAPQPFPHESAEHEGRLRVESCRVHPQPILGVRRLDLDGGNLDECPARRGADDTRMRSHHPGPRMLHGPDRQRQADRLLPADSHRLAIPRRSARNGPGGQQCAGQQGDDHERQPGQPDPTSRPLDEHPCSPGRAVPPGPDQRFLASSW